MSENKYLRTIVKALDDKKGNDIRVIRISEISSMCDYLVIADGSNRNQVQAVVFRQGLLERTWNIGHITFACIM